MLLSGNLLKSTMLYGFRANYIQHFPLANHKFSP